MYVKLFAKILDSSIWLESDSTVRVWITLLASMDSEGFCAFASVENLSRRARVKPCYTRAAVAILESPDPQSAESDHEGRRVERVAGGWLVLNAKKYREIRRGGDLRKRNNSSQLVATRNNSSQLVSPIDISTNGINKSLPEVEVEADKEEETKVVPVRLRLEDAPDGDFAFRELCEVYPKAERGHATQLKYLQAVEWVCGRKEISRKEAINYILERAHTYARLCRYQTKLSTWLGEMIFEQKDSAWMDLAAKPSGKVDLDELYRDEK